MHSQNSPHSFIVYLQRSRNKQSVCISPTSTYYLMTCNSILIHISEMLLWFGPGITSIQRLIQRLVSSSLSSQWSRTILRSAIEKWMELESHLNKVIQRIKIWYIFPIYRIYISKFKTKDMRVDAVLFETKQKL